MLFCLSSFLVPATEPAALTKVWVFAKGIEDIELVTEEPVPATLIAEILKE